MKGKKIRSISAMFLVISILFTSFMMTHAVQIEPRYVGASGLKANLSISTSAFAVCSGKITVRSGYTADLTVELKRDGTTIKTWTDSGTGSLSAGGTYYVTSGHIYVVTTTAEVRNSNGSLVETPSTDSSTIFYQIHKQDKKGRQPTGRRPFQYAIL